MKKRYWMVITGLCIAMLAGQAQAEERSVAIQKETDEQKNLPEEFFCFQMMIDGALYSFPANVKDWEEKGWENVTEEAVLLTPGATKSDCIFQREDMRILVSVKNQGENRAGISECSVIGIEMDMIGQEKLKQEEKDLAQEEQTEDERAAQHDENSDKAAGIELKRVELPGEIVLGKATAEEIEGAYGLPTSQYEGENYWQFTYRYGTQSYLRLEVDRETNVLIGLELENEIEQTGNTEVQENESDSSDLENRMQTATSPDASDMEQRILGDDLRGNEVFFDSHIYELPAALGEFLENGFSIVSEESDLEVASMESGFVVLQKDNRSVKIPVKNESDRKMAVRDCLVISLNSSQYEDGFLLVLPGEIQIGMTKEELEKKLENFDIVTDESDHFLYYGIQSQENELDETSIFVKKETGIVVKIQIERSRD